MTTTAQTPAPHSSKPLPPGSLGLPLLGEMREFIRNPTFFINRYQQYGPIFKTRILGRNTVILTGPEAAEFVLSKGMEHFSWRDGWPFTFKRLLGDSLFVQDGEEHRAKRKLIMPAFHREALRNYFGTMERIARESCERWETLGEFAWLPEMKRMTFQIASILLTGSEPGPQTDHLSGLFTQLTRGFITIPLNVPWLPYGKAIRAREAILQHIEQSVRYRQQHPTNDALGLLVQTRDEDGSALTMQELKDQSLLLLFAGHETSASMLTSFALALFENPEVWARARAEQDALNIGDSLTMEHTRQMPYLEQVLREVERLYPPVPGGFRGVVKGFEFQGYAVPQGWTAMYNIVGTHQDPASFPEPARFDPARFAPERELASRFSMVGFGGGPRVCVGFAFAQLEMKIVASYLLRHYTWEVLPGQDLSYTPIPTLQPRDGLKVRFRRL